MNPREAAARARSLLLRLLRNREALTVAGLSAFNAVAGLAANRVLTQLVPPRSLGELYLFLNLGLWFTLPSAAVFLYVHRHWALARERLVPRLFARGVLRGLLGQAGLATLAVLLVWALQLAPISAGAGLALLLGSCAYAVLQLVAQVQSLERRRLVAGLLELLNQPARLVFLGLGATLLLGSAPSGERLLWLHAAWGSALALLVLWLGWRLLRELAPDPDRGTPGPELSWSAATRFSLPFLGTALVTQLCTTAERWGLARIDDPASTALFVQAVGLSTAAAGAATGFIGTYFHPFIQQGAAKGSDPLEGARVPLRRFLMLSGAACALLALLGLTVSGSLTGLLFGPRYAAVSQLLPWTIAGAALSTFAQSMTLRSLVLRDAVGPNVARTVPLVLYAAVLLLLHPRHEAALAFSRLYFASQVLYLLLMLLLNARPVARSGLAREP